MSVIIPDEHKEEWPGWGLEGPRHPCFLCGNPVGEAETIMWMGSGGNEGVAEDTGNEQLDMVIDRLRERGPVTRALHIFFHPVCVPSFCRRLLMDFEKVFDGEDAPKGGRQN